MGEPVVMGLVGNAPFNIIILEFHPMPLQSRRHPLEFLNALVIIVNKYPGYMPVSRLDQKSQKTIGALFVVDRHSWVIQLLIVIIVKNDGNILLVNLHITVQVGIHQTRFYAVHDKPLKILMDYRLKAAPFIGKLIIRQKNAQIHLCLLYTSDAADD